MKINRLITTVVLCLFAVVSMAKQQPNLATVPSISGPQIEFTANKGQWHENILYQADIKGGRVYLEDHGITYFFYNQEDIAHLHPHEGSIVPNVVHAHAVKIDFLNANKQNQLTGIDSSNSIKNYYLGNDPLHWASGLHSYRKVNYNNLYNGINLSVYSNGSDFKYDFIVTPYSTPDVIRLNYSGCDRLYSENGKLMMALSVGTVEELHPYAYQVIDGITKTVSCEFVLKEHEVGFRFPKGYDHSQELVIDPTLVFSSYTGSVANNWGYTATYDAAGDLIVGGNVQGSGYPVTAGAYQLTYGGGGAGGNGWSCDIAIAKFNSTGSNLIYATYLGGSDNEEPHSLLVDGEDNLLVFGITFSANYPVTSASYSIIKNGGSDLIISKLNPTGTALLASTFVGGSTDDGINITPDFYTQTSLKFSYGDEARGEIICDANNNYYVTTATKSSDFPITAGVIQPTFGGSQDAVVFKMNKQLSTLLWSTFLGGNGDDAGYSLKLDTANNVYITGGTASTNFPTTAGTIHPAYQGGIDGFITHINPAATAILQSTFIGTNAYDQTFFVDLDKAGNVYVCGQTMGSYPITSGVYSNPGSGQFIHELNAQLNTTIFSTTFGTGTAIPNISESAFLVDVCGNIYVSGWGRCLNFGGVYPAGSVTGMPITANALQKTTDAGGCDYYFFVLSPNADSLAYATFFGGALSEEHVDGGTSRFDKRGTIYEAVCAGCWGNSDFPTTAGVYSRTNNCSSGCNNGVIKLNFGLATVNPAATAVPNTGGCVPLTVAFNSTYAANTTAHFWNFGDGSPTDTTQNTQHTFTHTGTYKVNFLAYGSCVPDTVQLTIKVDTTFKATATANPINGCAPLATFFSAVIDSNVSSHQWNFGDGSPIDTSISPQHVFTTSGTYAVTFIASNTCKSDTTHFTVTIPALVKATASVNPASGCLPLKVSFNGNAGANSTSHYWEFSDGFPNDTTGSPNHTFNNPGNYTATFISSGPCNTDSAHITVVADTTPTANFIFTATPCSPEINFVNSSISASSYLWHFDDGDSSTSVSLSHTYKDTGSYKVSLTAGYGKPCSSTDVQTVNVTGTDTTQLFVPNIFTPDNGDTLNNVFKIKGISKCHTYHIQIYNRWGKKLFETSDPTVFWDGKINGTDADEGVYYYLLEIDKQNLRGTVNIKR